MIMLVEFSIAPLGKGESVGEYVARCLEIVKGSGLPFKLNPMGTVIEGEYDEVMSVIRSCHMSVTSDCARVITTIKIDDRMGRSGTIESKVRSVEHRLSQGIKKDGV
ncbi:MAG: MTH1187 family thiamine-binding protein [Thermoplasmata archaeon]|nr:MTH1187 family thiamine-binding protein [Thermoplasmata archaeon]TFG70931.1 MAG: MTH1187 family thiamine-binding protein [Methanomassiliicoccus sp.]